MGCGRSQYTGDEAEEATSVAMVVSVTIVVSKPETRVVTQSRGVPLASEKASITQAQGEDGVDSDVRSRSGR